MSFAHKAVPTDQSSNLSSDLPQGISPQGDLWATYAAVRTFRWIGRKLPESDAQSVCRFMLNRQNADGGFAWIAGLPSDLWATFYASQTLSDLSAAPSRMDAFSNWVLETAAPEGGFAMMPGQSAEVWATYYACRVLKEISGRAVPEHRKLRDWIASLQVPSGGISWAPGHEATDIRAFYYATMAWATATDDKPSPWDLDKLQAWVAQCRTEQGALRFTPTDAPCTWAAFRGATAIARLGLELPDAERLRTWIDNRLTSPGFTRWEGYTETDVWANFTAVGTYRAIGRPLPDEVQTTVETSLLSMRHPSGGFTYRQPHSAFDTLSVASLMLRKEVAANSPHIEWIQAAAMPYESGVMYMPGRGSEVRCTLWALAACQMQGVPLCPTGRLVDWFRQLQNPDGGFGYWLGRGSDLASTTAVIECLKLLDVPAETVLDTASISRFVDRCRPDDPTLGYGLVPGAKPSVTFGAMAARSLANLGREAEAQMLFQRLQKPVALGAYHSGTGLPDLATTYQIVVTAHRLQAPIEITTKKLGRFLDRIERPEGVYWTPLGQGSPDPLAAALSSCVRRWIAEGDDPMGLVL